MILLAWLGKFKSFGPGGDSNIIWLSSVLCSSDKSAANYVQSASEYKKAWLLKWVLYSSDSDKVCHSQQSQGQCRMTESGCRSHSQWQRQADKNIESDCTRSGAVSENSKYMSAKRMTVRQNQESLALSKFSAVEKQCVWTKSHRHCLEFYQQESVNHCLKSKSWMPRPLFDSNVCWAQSMLLRNSVWRKKLDW